MDKYTKKVKRAQMKKGNSLMLWRSINAVTPDNKIFEALQEILKRLTCGTERITDIFTPAGIHALLRLLTTEHDTQVYTLVVALLSVASTDQDLHNYLMKKNAMNPLLLLFDKSVKDVDPNSARATLQIQLYEHMLNLILSFTTGQRSTKEACLFENVIGKVALFLSHKSKSHSLLYGYNEQSLEDTMQLIQGKELVAKVRVIESDQDFDSIACKHLGKINQEVKANLKVNKQFFEIQLFDTSSDVDIMIAKELINKNSAWPATNENTKGEETWQDVFVSVVLTNQYMFSHIGEESINLVSKVEKGISSQPEKQRHYLKRLPLPGNFVCALNPNFGYYRGQVLRSDEDICEVYAIDHGFIEKIQYEKLFLATKDMGIGTIQPQATLCKLKGISGKFRFPKIAELGLSILVNMSSMQSSVSHFNQEMLLEDLYRIACSPDRVMASKVFRIFCNLCRSDRVRTLLNRLGIMRTVLDCCKRSSEEFDKCANQVAVESGLAVLANVLFRSDDNKSQFVEENGVETLLPLLSDKVPPRVRQAALKTLKIFISTEGDGMSCDGRGQSFPRKDHEMQAYSIVVDNVTRGRKKTRPESAPVERAAFRDLSQDRARSRENNSNETPSISTMGGSLYSKETRLTREEERCSKPRTRSRSRSLGRPPLDDVIEKRVVANINKRQSTDEDSPEVSEDEDDDDFAGASGMRSTGRTALDDESSGTDNGEKVIKANDKKKVVKLVNALSHYNKKTEHPYYVQGTNVAFVPDETHEFRTIRSVQRVSSEAIAKLVCGFLNNRKGGTIYFGLQKEGTVLGMHINRDERDEFRIGVDRVLTNNLRPPLMMSQYDIICTPVVLFAGYKDNETRKPIQDRNIVEIKIKAYNGYLLYSTSEDEAYIREGNTTILASAQDRHVRMIEEKEENYLLEMQVLQSQIKKLRFHLQSNPN